MINTPLVSICMITYNHEKFIEEAINGVLMQETDFDVELIISNDNSPDQTDVIVQRILKKHPNAHWIKYIKHEQNLGMKLNGIDNLQRCTGKYIACCEGDDYWTDPYKLQKQVDFLENNDDFSICYHDVSILQNGKFFDSHVPVYPEKEFLTIVDLAHENCIHTPTCMFRNNLFGKFPDVFDACGVGDYVLHLLNAQYGKIKYLPENMAVYRKHPGGVWSGRQLTSKLNAWLDLLSILMLYFIDHHEVLEALQNQRLRILMRLIEAVNTKNDKDILLAVLRKSSERELEHVAEFIIKNNEELNITRDGYNNISYLSDHLGFKIILKLVLKKLYCRISKR